MTTDVHSLLAPYALDALDADDRARFEAHLEQCDDCRDELDGFVATAGRLGDAVSLTPPPDLRARVLGAVSSVPQQPPVVTVLHQRGRLPRVLPRIIAAAAVVIALAGVGGFIVERQHAQQLEARQDAITAVMTAPDASMRSSEVPDGGSLRMIASDDRGSAVLIATQLPALDDRTYQLWTLHDGEAVPQDTFGSSGVVLVEALDAADSIAITIEPEGGSSAPTTDPIATMPI